MMMMMNDVMMLTTTRNWTENLLAMNLLPAMDSVASRAPPSPQKIPLLPYEVLKLSEHKK